MTLHLSGKRYWHGKNQESPFGPKLKCDVFLIMYLISAARYTNAFILSYTSRNNKNAKVDWQFTTKDARIKLSRLYPTIES
jgi:hypothetical protein